MTSKELAETWDLTRKSDMNLVIGGADVAPHDHVIDIPRSGKAKVSCVLALCHVFYHPFGLPWQRDISAMAQRVKCSSLMAKLAGPKSTTVHRINTGPL